MNFKNISSCTYGCVLGIFLLSEIQVALDEMIKHKGKWVTLEDLGLVTEDLKNAVSCIRETLGGII